MCWFSLKCLDAVRKFSGGGPINLKMFFKYQKKRSQRKAATANLERRLETMASEYWFCRYYDEARLRKGLPGFDIETGIHYYCPKQFSSLIAFKTHAGKVHRGRSGTNSGLRFKHVIAQPPKEKARSALPVLRAVRLIGRTRSIVMMPVTWTLILRQSVIAGLENVWPTWSMMRRWSPPRILQTSHRQKKKERRMRTDGHL